MNYNIDISKLLRRLTPWFLRTPIFLALLGSISTVVKAVNTLFYDFTVDTKYFLSFNGQIVYLERRLNDEFSLTYAPATRETDIAGNDIIYIESISAPSEYLFNKAELRDPRYIFNDAENLAEFYVYNDAENAAIDTDNFIINIPAAVTYDENVVRSIVNAYKPAGKTYSIVTY